MRKDPTTTNPATISGATSGKGNNMKTIKKTISEPCPCCKQRWTREVDVPAPVDGMTFYVVMGSNSKVDLTIEYHDVIDTSLNGDTDVVTDLTFNNAIVFISVFAQQQLKDNTYLRVESNIMDTYEISDRRITLDATNIQDALKTLRKAYRQARRVWTPGRL
tara:strand:- start:2118 stop:2603 length:486 start_codon:yes stop_codon:yes gene_type:complete